jgi:hypothetical protein
MKFFKKNEVELEVIFVFQEHIYGGMLIYRTCHCLANMPLRYQREVITDLLIYTEFPMHFFEGF